MSRQSRTLNSILTYVNEFIDKEGAKPSPEFVRLLADQALAEIAEGSGAKRSTWTNATGGELTLTGNTVAMPSDCLLVTSIEFDGSDNPLERTTVGELDRDTPGWREETGDPDKWAIEGRNIVFNASASNAEGKVVARGYGMLAAFSDTTGAENPLDTLPYPRQLSIAKYVVAHYPVAPDKPRTDSEWAVIAARDETRRREKVRDEHKAMWAAELAACVDWVKARSFEEFSY
jgi:hypothetical protein